MSSLVVVKKSGKAVIAADSLTTFGRTKFGKRYQRNTEKILRFERSYIGIVPGALRDLEHFYELALNTGMLVNSVDPGSPAARSVTSGILATSNEADAIEIPSSR